MRIPFIDLKRQHQSLKQEIDCAIKKAVTDGNFILGEAVLNFEKNIGEYLGSKAIGCASGSDALLLALMALDIKEGDEVITSPFTFFATAGAIARLKAKPVFIDIDKRTFNIDANLIEEAVTIKTKAIIPVHLFGQPCDMDKITRIASKHNLAVIEDACQAVGAEFKCKKAGTIGDFGCFSFFPSKNLGGFGDGGLVVCKSDEKYRLVKKLRVHGAEIKYYHDLIGINSRLDALQAAILNIKLKYLDEWNNKRMEIAKKYSDSGLNEIIATPVTADKVKHIFHQYAVLTERRDELFAFLRKKEIIAGIYYPLPLHLQKCFSYLGYKKGDFPSAEKISDTILSLPVFSDMRGEEINYVIEAIKKFAKK